MAEPTLLPGTTGPERQKAIRDVAGVAAQRVALVVSGVLFAVTVPRLMGTAAYGRFDLLSSLALWCLLASEFSLTVAVGRRGPAARRCDDPARTAALFGNLLLFRVATSLLTALVFWALAGRLAADVPADIRLLFTLLVPAGALAEALFSFLLGLDRAQRWGAGYLVRRWLGLATVIAGFRIAGLRGAALGLLAAEAATILLGFAWTRGALTLRGLRPDPGALGPALRLGAGFFAGAILTATFRHGGDAVLRLLGAGYRDVAVFGLGMSIFAAADAALAQIAVSFAPTLGRFLTDGRREEIGGWHDKLVESLAVPASWLFLGALFLGGDVVPLLFGADYAPLAPGAVLVSLMIVAAVPATGAWILAIVIERPALNTRAGALRLAVFLAGAAALTPRWGGVGGLGAALAATVAAALLFSREVGARLPVSPRRFLAIVALAAAFSPLAALKSSIAVNAALFALALGGHAMLLARLGLLRGADLRNLREALFRRPR